MVNDNLTILTHTHTDCSDLWLPYFDSYDAFFTNKNHVVLINEKIGDTLSTFNLDYIIYDEGVKYSDRLLLALNKIKTDYVLISFEDMILYDNVNIHKLNELMYFIKKVDGFYVRLIKSGVKSNKKINDNIFLIENGDYKLSITPTIWDRVKLIHVLSNFKNLTVWELEREGNRRLTDDYKCFYHFNNENKRGGHYDSSIYPHICSAILKGKWNLKEYKNELESILIKYNINPNDRGYV
jgi:hypothetical protein